MEITGRDLIDAGFPQGPEFGKALEHARAKGLAGDALVAWVAANAPAPRIKMQDSPGYHLNIEGATDLERENVAKVQETMDVLMRTPTIVAGAVMPDACPAGPVGTIPVGGVAVARNAIHPGMHSADICCSVMVTEFADADPAKVLDAIHAVTHFGPGGRANGKRFTLSPHLYEAMSENPFLSGTKALQAAAEHMGTQGDGNHFAFVGVSEQTGKTMLVTHHGSRGPGSLLYKKGMALAEKWRTKLSEGIPKQNAWIPADTDDGRDYWAALQIIRKWTKANHSCLHTAAADLVSSKIGERFWNEHNFVFQEDELFYHAKGATPVHNAFLPDSQGVQIVPLNMGEPVLLVQGEKTPTNLGFAPHGAGRNLSRTAHKRTLGGAIEDEVFRAETGHIDARFFSGNIDTSELPSAYKSAAEVVRQMEHFGLCRIVDRIMPHGSIMAGDWERDAFWRVKKRDAVA